MQIIAHICIYIYIYIDVHCTYVCRHVSMHEFSGDSFESLESHISLY